MALFRRFSLLYPRCQQSASACLWHQQIYSSEISMTVETLPPPPLGIQVVRPNKAAYFIQIKVSLSAEVPIWINNFCSSANLKKKKIHLQSRFWRQWSFQRLPSRWEKTHKKRIRFAAYRERELGLLSRQH